MKKSHIKKKTPALLNANAAVPMAGVLERRDASSMLEPTPPENNATLQSIVMQLQAIAEQLKGLETTHANLTARLDAFEKQTRQDTRAAVIEIGSLRAELLGERKALGAVSVFNGVVPLLDSLRAMHAALSDDPTAPVYRQVDSIVEDLTMMLRGLGFTEFEPTVGEPFDPSRMEFSGYVAGPAGMVIAITRRGYRTAAGVIRPAGVLLGNSTTVS